LDAIEQERTKTQEQVHSGDNDNDDTQDKAGEDDDNDKKDTDADTTSENKVITNDDTCTTDGGRHKRKNNNMPGLKALRKPSKDATDIEYRGKKVEMRKERCLLQYHSRLHFQSLAATALSADVLLLQTEAAIQNPTCFQQESTFYKVLAVPSLRLNSQAQWRLLFNTLLNGFGFSF
jgi:hypothetical protein